MAKYFETKSAADAAARRTLKAMFGKSYMPKIGVDFIVCRSSYGENYGKWRFDMLVTA